MKGFENPTTACAGRKLTCGPPVWGLLSAPPSPLRKPEGCAACAQTSRCSSATGWLPARWSQCLHVHHHLHIIIWNMHSLHGKGGTSGFLNNMRPTHTIVEGMTVQLAGAKALSRRRQSLALASMVLHSHTQSKQFMLGVEKPVCKGAQRMSTHHKGQQHCKASDTHTPQTTCRIPEDHTFNQVLTGHCSSS